MPNSPRRLASGTSPNAHGVDDELRLIRLPKRLPGPPYSLSVVVPVRSYSVDEPTQAEILIGKIGKDLELSLRNLPDKQPGFYCAGKATVRPPGNAMIRRHWEKSIQFEHWRSRFSPLNNHRQQLRIDAKCFGKHEKSTGWRLLLIQGFCVSSPAKRRGFLGAQL